MILVTGASGLLGLHLLEALTTGRHTPIKALYNSTLPRFQHPLVTWIQVDLMDVYAVARVMEGVKQVYHCAAIVSFDSAKRDQLIYENEQITAHIVDEAIAEGIDKMVMVSSIAALGRVGAETGKPIDENTHWEDSKNNTAYAISKYRSEMEVWRGMAEGLNVAIVNPGIILGEGDFSKGSAQLMTNVAKEFPYYTKGVNGYVDVKDVVKAMLLLMDSDISGERYVLVEGNHSYQDLFTTMAQALGVKSPTKFAQPWMAEVVWRLDYLKSKLTGKHPLITKETARTAQSKSYYNNEKFLKAFPEFAYTPLEVTVKRMAEAYKKQ